MFAYFQTPLFLLAFCSELRFIVTHENSPFKNLLASLAIRINIKQTKYFCLAKFNFWVREDWSSFAAANTFTILLLMCCAWKAPSAVAHIPAQNALRRAAPPIDTSTGVNVSQVHSTRTHTCNCRLSKGVLHRPSIAGARPHHPGCSLWHA